MRLGIVSCGATVALVLIIWKRLKFFSLKNEKKDKNDECVDGKTKNENIKALSETNTIESNNKINDENYNDNNLIEDLPEPRWMKVGQIKELFYYPLKSGRGKNLNNCEFTDYGINVKNDGLLTLKDRQ